MRAKNDFFMMIPLQRFLVRRSGSDSDRQLFCRGEQETGGHGHVKWACRRILRNSIMLALPHSIVQLAITIEKPYFATERLWKSDA
jgi:hypothetical protein